jgi:predicted MFS family arabinose efflux permease
VPIIDDRSNQPPSAKFQGVQRYKDVLRTKGAAKFFFAAGIGRLGISMTGLGILWLVQHSTGSFAAAGVVTGAFAISEALMGPQIARHIDHRGQTRLLPPLLLVHGLAAAALISSVVLDAPFIATCLAAVAAGASVPQLGALSTARWSNLLDGSRLTTAFSLEAVANDVAFLAGPALVGLISALVHPIAGSVCAAGLIIIGGLALGVQRTTAPPFGFHPLAKVLDKGIMVPAFFILAVVNIGLGLFFGSMQLSVTAFAVEHAVPQLGGVLYSVMSLASLLGGLFYGARRWKFPPERLLLGIAGYLAVATAVLTVADTVWSLAALLIIVGVAIAPMMVLSSVLTERKMESWMLTQAFTWMNSASSAGIAAAAALSGTMIDSWGAAAGFGCVAIVAVVVAGTAALGQRSLN